MSDDRCDVTTATMVDLVADLGEGFGAYRSGDDENMLRVVSSANIACGFHAGDPRIMDRTVGACVRLGVEVGAHPGFPDLVGFGRRAIDASSVEVETDVLYQIGALAAFAQAHGTRVKHVTPHGRLGNLIVTDARYAQAVAEAVARFDPSLIVVSQPGAMREAAEERGLRWAGMALADRAYQSDGTLVPRREPGAVVTDEDAIAERVRRMVTEGRVMSVNGTDVEVPRDTILLHSDTLGAVALATRVRAELEREGVQIAPLAEVLGARVAGS
jgi:5-oxoprolinase (ATP-hydrolysing) subunit A